MLIFVERHFVFESLRFVNFVKLTEVRRPIDVVGKRVNDAVQELRSTVKSGSFKKAVIGREWPLRIDTNHGPHQDDKVKNRIADREIVPVEQIPSVWTDEEIVLMRIAVDWFMHRSGEGFGLTRQVCQTRSLCLHPMK